MDNIFWVGKNAATATVFCGHTSITVKGLIGFRVSLKLIQITSDHLNSGAQIRNVVLSYLSYTCKLLQVGFPGKWMLRGVFSGQTILKTGNVLRSTPVGREGSRCRHGRSGLVRQACRESLLTPQMDLKLRWPFRVGLFWAEMAVSLYPPLHPVIGMGYPRKYWTLGQVILCSYSNPSSDGLTSLSVAGATTFLGRDFGWGISISITQASPLQISFRWCQLDWLSTEPISEKYLLSELIHSNNTH